MHVIDYAIVIAVLLGLLEVGRRLSKKAGSSTDEFILAGRKMPWWLAGASVLAASLNTSGMLTDARKVRQDGIGGLWFTWRSAVTGSIAAAFFYRLWRRAAFVTQMEFYRCRYHGPRADIARTYDSVVYGLISAPMWAAIGLVGMKKIASVVLGLEPTFTLMGWEMSTDLAVVLTLVVVATVFTVVAGVHGVVWTDLIEAAIAIAASYALMVIVLMQVGGPVGLRDQLMATGQGDHLLSLAPGVGLVIVFYIVFGVLEQGGYNPHVQRSLGVKDEREVIYTQLFSMTLNFSIKSLPYIVCGLAGYLLIQDGYLTENFKPGMGADGNPIADHEMVVPALVRTYLPIGLTGMMVAAFLCAFMSSFDTCVHNATSIFTNDIYRAYLAPGKSEGHYVAASRVYTVVATITATVIGLMVQDIFFLFLFLLAVLQSVGLVKLLRFIWWRSNAWGELAGQASSLVITTLLLCGVWDTWVRWIIEAVGLEVANDTLYVFRTLLMVVISTTVSVLAILLTPPEPMDTLVGFYRRVRPFGFWGPVRERAAVEAEASDSLLQLSLLAVSMISVAIGMVMLCLGLAIALWVALGVGVVMTTTGLFLFRRSIMRLYPDGGSSPNREIS